MYMWPNLKVINLRTLPIIIKYKLYKFIYGIKKVLMSWNIYFDDQSNILISLKNIYVPYVYKKVGKREITSLILYVHNILIEDDISLF